MPTTYRIPSIEHVHTRELEVKRSRFISYIKQVDDQFAAKAFIQEVRNRHPQARHVCWAYIAGPPDTTVRSMSDDGEPTGTAGKPMLNVLQHSGLGEIAVAVVRYFGGIKLGKGGLQRAYADSTSLVLQDLPTEEQYPKEYVKLEYEYRYESSVLHLCRRYSGEIRHSSYQDVITCELVLPSNQFSSFKDALAAHSDNKVILTRLRS